MSDELITPAEAAEYAQKVLTMLEDANATGEPVPNTAVFLMTQVTDWVVSWSEVVED